MRKNNCIILFLAAILLTALTFAPAVSYAQNDESDKPMEWEIHKSITNIFEVKFPERYKYKIFPFQFNDDTTAFALEITSSLDGDTGKKEKSVLIKALQTFGGELTYWDVKNALKRETNKYKQAAEAMGGALVINEDIKHNGFMGKKFYITYRSKGKKYGLRITVYMTNYSKIEQVLSGAAGSMYAYRADDFFDSMKPLDGITKKENPIGVGWVEYPSKNNIFTAVLPPKNSDYTPLLPKFTATPKYETMTFKISDPVINKDVTYNIYAYKSKKKLSNKNILSILFSTHISKFVQNARTDNLKTENTVVDGVTTMRTKLIISPTETYPDITSIFIEARFKGNTLVVQELLTSNSHARSRLNKTLFSLMKFHPDKYKAVKTKEAPKEDSKAPPAP